jgi:SNF2 family DNA or RNA helicase
VSIDEWVELGGADRTAYLNSGWHLMHIRRAATLGSRSMTSGKLGRLAELLEEYEGQGMKVVVFSYFREVLDAVSELAGGCRQIHGGVTSAARQAIIDEFGDARGHALLASQVEAGGIGVNLQAAQVVVLMEPQFKPSTEQQAIARVHRMGQARTVNVHRLLAADTVDEHLVRLIQSKQKLFDAYAHDSAVRDASTMATDPSGSELEHELTALLRTERGRQATTARK